MQETLFSNELKKWSEGADDTSVEGLNIRGRSKKKKCKPIKDIRSKSKDMTYEEMFYAKESGIFQERLSRSQEA